MSAVLLPHRPRGLRLLVALAGGTLLSACGSDQDLPLAPDVQLPAVEAQAPYDVVSLSAPYLVDQANTRVNPKATLAIFPNPKRGQILRQVVRQGRAGQLGYLDLPVSCAVGTLLNVRVTDTLGTRVYAEINVSVPSRIDGSFSTVQLFNPATSSGIPMARFQYWAFELRAVPIPGTTTAGTCGIAREAVANGYPHDDLYTWDDTIPGFPDLRWRRRWSNDLPFRTLVR